MKTKLEIYGLLLLALLSSCHVNKYYADRRLPQEPPPKTEELSLSILEDDPEAPGMPTGIVLDEAPVANAHPGPILKQKVYTPVVNLSTNQQQEQTNTGSAPKTNPVITSNDSPVETSGKNQNMAVFLSLLAGSLLVGLWSLAYVFFTAKPTWIPLAAISIALFVSSLYFLMTQPIA